MNRFVWAGRAGLLWMALAIGTPALAAEPTLNQVYEAVHAGRLNQAHGMMTEVLRNHPDSAKAHYVEAEILAKEGRYGEAHGELNRAERRSWAACNGRSRQRRTHPASPGACF